jgi:hypothetical protein
MPVPAQVDCFTVERVALTKMRLCMACPGRLCMACPGRLFPLPKPGLCDAMKNEGWAIETT